MPGWPSRLLYNTATGQSSSRRAPSPDSLYDGDFDLPDIPIPFATQERCGSSGVSNTYGSPPPQGSSNAPRMRPHMHTSSDKIFGSGRTKKPSQNQFEPRSYPSVADPLSDRGPLGPRLAKGKADEREMEAGSCATCDTKVKWPKGINEFRCGTCLMVNDLKPALAGIRAPRDAAPQQAIQASSQQPAGVSGPNRSMSPMCQD